MQFHSASPNNRDLGVGVGPVPLILLAMATVSKPMAPPPFTILQKNIGSENGKMEPSPRKARKLKRGLAHSSGLQPSLDTTGDWEVRNSRGNRNQSLKEKDIAVVQGIVLQRFRLAGLRGWGWDEKKKRTDSRGMIGTALPPCEKRTHRHHQGRTSIYRMRS